MDVKVRFRYNKVTGEVEVFDVEQEHAPGVSDADHNRAHDRIAAEIGRVIERNPLVSEQFPGLEPDNPEPEQEQEKEPATHYEKPSGLQR